MKLFTVSGLVFLQFCFNLAWTNEEDLPQQVHLSLGSDETEMVVTWVTMHHIHGGHHAYVRYGHYNEENLNHEETAEVTKFHHHGTKFYTYRALMSGLHPNTKYYYKVGRHHMWSSVFHFRSTANDAYWLPVFAIYGDLGYKNGRSIRPLKYAVREDAFDVIFHIGDISYDLNSHHGERGNEFMRAIEPIAAHVPYLVVPGNHDKKSNFSHYDARFSMIGGGPNRWQSLTDRVNNFFYSHDIGPAHIIMLNTEFYYYTRWGWDQIRVQYEWLVADLEKANANRQERPWIIVMGHRPLYCAKYGDTSCDQSYLERPDLRRGIPWEKNENDVRYGLEELFYKYGVDLFFGGHMHTYWRSAPMHDFKVAQGEDGDRHHYTNPSGPIHITSGNAGCWEEHSEYIMETPWLVSRFQDYGYSLLKFESRHKVRIQQLSVEKNQEVIDEVTIFKEGHHPAWMKSLGSSLRSSLGSKLETNELK